MSTGVLSARLQSLATSGFVPASLWVLERLGNLVILPERGRYNVVDLTAGEGDFFAPFNGPRADLYGIEISVERVARARERYPRGLMIHAPYEECSIPRGKVSVALGNVPYVYQDGERLEYLLISSRLTPALQAGGLLITLLPARSAWTPTLINHLVKHYTDIGVWVVPGEPFERYTQICVTAVKRAKSLRTIEQVIDEKARLEQWIYETNAAFPKTRAWRGGSPPPDLPLEPVVRPYQVQPALGRLVIRVHCPDPSLVLHYLQETGVHTTPEWDVATTWRPDVDLEQPLMEITGEAHIAACAMLDMFAGEVFEDAEGKQYTFLAHLDKEWVKIEPTLDEFKDHVVDIRQEQDLLQLSVLNLASGDIEHVQGDAVYGFLAPWLPSMRVRIQKRYPPLYNGQPDRWLVEATALIGLDRTLKGSSSPGLVREQLECVWAMWYALCKHGWVALAGEQGVGKTRMHLALMAAYAHAWSHAEELFGLCPPRWIKGLRRAWTMNPLTKGKQPRALPALVSTPCNVVPVWQEEIRTAWPEAEVLVIEDHTDVRLWFERCAQSAAPIVIALLSQSLTRATRRRWVPAVICKKIPLKIRDLSDTAYEAGGVPDISDNGTLLGYRDPLTDEPMWTTKWVEHFHCPQCGRLLMGYPRSTKKKKTGGDQTTALPTLANLAAYEPEAYDERAEALNEDEAVLGEEESVEDVFDEMQVNEDRLVPVGSLAYFTFKPRWCSCGSPLWTDARNEADQRKRPCLSFAQWTQAIDALKTTCLAHHSGPTATMDLHLTTYTSKSGRPLVRLTSFGEGKYQGPMCLVAATTLDRAQSVPLRANGEVIGYRLPDGEEVSVLYTPRTRRVAGYVSQRTGMRLKAYYGWVDPPADSFSPPAYLKQFFRGCTAYMEVDESHNIRNRATDIGEATYAAQDAAQCYGHGTGTPYGGLLKGFFYGQARLNFRFWHHLGYGWNDCGRACRRYGFSRIVTREYENPALRGTGRTIVSDSIQSSPGIAVALIPRLFSNYIDLTLAQLGTHLPARVEIPILVPMEDPVLQQRREQIDQCLIEAQRQEVQAHQGYTILSPSSSAEKAEVESASSADTALACARVQWEEAKANLTEVRREHKQANDWINARDLAQAYHRAEKDLGKLATKIDAVKLAQQWLLRLWTALPFWRDPHYMITEKERGEWGELTGEKILYSMPCLEEHYLYPLERKLQEIVAHEVAAGRPTAVAFLQNGKRFSAQRLAWVLQDFHPWTLTNDIKPVERERAIKNAVAAGYLVLLIPFERTLEGLNLQEIVNGIWFELPDRLFHLEQWQRRFWRLGQNQEVHLYFLAYTGSTSFYTLYRLGMMSAALSLFVGKAPDNALAHFVGAHKSALARLSAAITTGELGEQEAGEFIQLLGQQIVAAFEQRNTDYQALTSAAGTEQDDEIQQWLRIVRMNKLSGHSCTSANQPTALPPAVPLASAFAPILPVEHPWDDWRLREQDLRRAQRQQRAQEVKEKAHLRRILCQTGQTPHAKSRPQRERKNGLVSAVQPSLW